MLKKLYDGFICKLRTLYLNFIFHSRYQINFHSTRNEEFIGDLTKPSILYNTAVNFMHLCKYEKEPLKYIYGVYNDLFTIEMSSNNFSHNELITLTVISEHFGLICEFQLVVNDNTYSSAKQGWIKIHNYYAFFDFMRACEVNVFKTEPL